MLRCFVFPLALLAVDALYAQNGDRPNESQGSLPPGLVIPPAPVLVAEDALKTIRVAEDYRLEIAAADPLIGDPVAATFGPDGRLWVVEMRGFMPNPDGLGEDAKVGTIAVLTDTDHDGRFDQRTEFLDGLVLPRSILLVGDGLLVAEPPHLWFARDTDGDGRADVKTEIASDYGTPGNPEHNANSLFRALDNWIYSANHNVRFRYRGDGKFDREFTIMRGQWGLSQDDGGRLFYNTNSDPLRYDAVPSHYFARQPALTEPAGLNVQIVPANLRIWPARVTPGVNRGYQNLDATGRITTVTAACAPLVYRGTLTPELRDSVFVCEPSGNLIKRITLDRSGDLITGRSAVEGTEFIASTDERFRPVNLHEGPDGALYVVDLYRGIIQHRIYLTTFLRKQIESRGLAEGLGMGRIYRIAPTSGVPRSTALDLTQQTTAQLVSHLASPNGWTRDTAQRLLVERRDPAAIPLLRAFLLLAKTPAVARLHLLWTLEGIDALDRETVLAALSDAEETVRIAAIRLSEKFLVSGDTEILTTLLQRQPTTQAQALQQCLSLGEAKSSAVVLRLLDLARTWGERPLIADAVVSSLARRENDFLSRALPSITEPGVRRVANLAAAAVWRTGDAEAVTALNRLLETAPESTAANTLLFDSLQLALGTNAEGKLKPGRLAAAPTSLATLAATASPSQAKAAELLALLSWPGNENKIALVTPLSAEEEKLFAKGRGIFSGICSGCHQPTGLGLKGLAPALVGSKWVAGDERTLARIVLQGKFREGSVMPPLASLDDESLAGVLTFIRRSWGHGFAPITPGQITRARTETAGRTEPWTDKELAKWLETHSVTAPTH